jgi:trimeric autotransporter adhesin
MKKQNQQLKKLFIGAMVFFTAFGGSLQAQTYFAGAGAGTGNTGAPVTAVGPGALSSANSGVSVDAFGNNALQKNTTGHNNAAFGTNALAKNTSGSFNTAAGNAALFFNTIGYNNTGLGFSAMQLNTTGYDNTAIGNQALLNNTTGFRNSAFGSYSLYSNTTGNYNNAIGYKALYSNVSGYNNVAIGNFALSLNTTGAVNTAIGSTALQNNTTGGQNTAIGSSTLNLNTTGSQNTATGFNALAYNTTGIYNSAYGYSSLQSNKTGIRNTATGAFALNSNTIGNYSVATGHNALSSNTSGDNNVATGADVLVSNTTGSQNAAFGRLALRYNTTGSYNVAVGDGSGGQFELYNNCTFLGSNADATLTGLTNATALGNGARVNASNKVVVGNTAITSIGGQVGWTTFSDLNLKTNINKSTLGLNFILQLNPVTYNYKAEGQKEILYTGLIAQEVDAAAKKTGIAFSGIDKTGEHWGIRYAELTVPIIKAVQEQNENITAVQEENKQLKLRIEKLEKAFAGLQGGSITDAKAAASVLYQNSPNPYTNTTTIKYALAPAVTHAQLIIRNSAGATVKTINLSSMGAGHVIINAKEMAAGIYTCTLYTNGQLADTKMLVQTK